MDMCRLTAGCSLPASRSDALDMNQNPPDSPSTSTATTLPQPIDPRALSAALAGIRADSERESDTYLRDTVVPHGGE